MNSTPTVAAMFAFAIAATPATVQAGFGGGEGGNAYADAAPQPEGDLVDYSIDDGDEADAGGDGDGDGDGDGGLEGPTTPPAPVLDQRGVPTASNDFSFMALRPKRGLGLTIAGGTLFTVGLAGSAGGALLVIKTCSRLDDEGIQDAVTGSLGCTFGSVGGAALYVLGGIFQFTGVGLAIPGAARMGKHAAFENHFIRRQAPKKTGILVAVGAGVMGAGLISWIAGPIIKKARCPVWADVLNIDPTTGERQTTGRDVVRCGTGVNTTAFNVGLTGITVGSMMLAYGVQYKKMAKRHAITYPLSNVRVVPSFDRGGGSLHLMGRF